MPVYTDPVDTACVAMMRLNPTCRRTTAGTLTGPQARSITNVLDAYHLLSDATAAAARDLLRSTNWACPTGLVESREIVVVLSDAGLLRRPFGGVK